MITDIKFKPGDTVSIFEKVEETEGPISSKKTDKIQGKTRTQVFKGTVIGIRGREENKTFRVRKLSSAGVWVEKIWPIKSLNLEKIEIEERPKKRIRRAKLYNLNIASA